MSMQPMDTLRLDGDDSDDVAEALEEAFAITFEKAEGPFETVGDVQAMVVRKLAAELGRPGACATAMVFYRLRRALTASGMDQARLTPTTSLAALANGRPSDFLRRLARQSGLLLPLPLAGGPATAGCFSLMAAAVTAVVVFSGFAWAKVLVAGVLVAAGVLLIALDRGRLPAGCRSLGDLAQRGAALNHARLVEEGATVRERQVRQAVVEVIADVLQHPAERITSETRLFKPRRAA